MLYYDQCFKQLASLLYTYLNVGDLYGRHLAYQVDIVDVNKPFYIEITTEGKLNVEPYEYNDRDALIRGSFEVLMKIITKQISIEEAISKNLLQIDGNVDSIKLLYTLLK